MIHEGNCAHESRTRATPNMPGMLTIDESVMPCDFARCESSALAVLVWPGWESNPDGLSTSEF